ncbi:hypothetical protein CEXT_681271 [Caerostris extrusa]|uniref:Uncharacterized protein n=1 Tax=Caerostris extrusa TaxID=172846 RepID=A0AAV4RAY8_CAEEX|nr:hypothetical protein CEXT_681271 [Caerostris extrusa]
MQKESGMLFLNNTKRGHFFRHGPSVTFEDLSEGLPFQSDISNRWKHPHSLGKKERPPVSPRVRGVRQTIHPEGHPQPAHGDTHRRQAVRMRLLLQAVPIQERLD